MTKAAQCVASFLLFHPENEAMLNNKNYFTEELKVDLEAFQPRSEAVSFKTQQDSEKYLLEYIEREFASIGDIKHEVSNFYLIKFMLFHFVNH